LLTGQGHFTAGACDRQTFAVDGHGAHGRARSLKSPL
jgi:hypothetical protein